MIWLIWSCASHEYLIDDSSDHRFIQSMIHLTDPNWSSNRFTYRFHPINPSVDLVQSICLSISFNRFHQIIDIIQSISSIDFIWFSQSKRLSRGNSLLPCNLPTNCSWVSIIRRHAVHLIDPSGCGRFHLISIRPIGLSLAIHSGLFDILIAAHRRSVQGLLCSPSSVHQTVPSDYKRHIRWRVRLIQF